MKNVLHLSDSSLVRELWTALATAPQAALLLDYDGTLAPFQVDPAQAQPYSGVEPLLERIGRLAGDRLVIVSGRALDDLRPLLALDVEPEFWGCHGRERRLPDGRHSLIPPPEAAQPALAEAEGWTVAVTALGGRIERKTGSLAFHWRGLPVQWQAALRQSLAQCFADLPDNDTLAWHDFDGGIELRAAGCDKGRAVRQVLTELEQGACVAYLGDDHTDEDAFAALAGHGLRVLVRPQWRATGADLWLCPPDGLRAFLGRWADLREEFHARG